MDGLKTGNDALKKANEMFSIEEIEAIMDDTAEAVAKQREIDDLISGQLTAEDEDDVLKELEALADLEEAEATNAVKNREPIMTSKNFIQQYFMSFANDPVKERLAELEEGEVPESSFGKALAAFKADRFDDIIGHCTEEIEADGEDKHVARLLRATFYVLSKQQVAAFEERHPEFVREEAPHPIDGSDTDGALLIAPNPGVHDGMFMARWRKG